MTRCSNTLFARKSLQFFAQRKKPTASIHRSSADVRFPPKPHEGRGCSGLRKKYRNIFEYIPIAYGVVAVEMIARASLAPSKMLNTTLKKQFLDIARSAL